jgi:hypothetical protein
MGRVNKLIEGVFTDIVGTPEQVSSYDVFMNNEAKHVSKELKSFLESYRKIIIKNKTEFEKLAKMEEIIMQLRSRDNINDIKLSLVREYIYARCSFYRNDKIAKDIRIIVGNVEFWDANLDNLLKNKTFMDTAKEKLVKAMTKEINDNISVYKALYNNSK